MTPAPSQRQPEFGRAAPGRPRPADAADLDLAALREGGNDAAAHTPAPRWLRSALGLLTLLLAAGGIYFIHVLLAFKAEVESDITAIYGPYPNVAIIFVIFPAWAALCYFLYEALRLGTGRSLRAAPRAMAAGAGCAVLLLIAGLGLIPMMRHHDNHFARLHGYIRCASPFDPAHVRIYALKTYTDAYGCPTVSLPH